MTAFRSQDIANIAWAYAKIACADCPLLAAIAESSMKKLSAFEPRSLTNLAWAIAVLAFINHPLLNSIAAAAITNYF